MNVPVDSLEVDATAVRRDEHPTVLTSIEIVYSLLGSGLTSEVVEHAVNLAEKKLCPVLAMLRPGTQLASRWERNRSGRIDEAKPAFYQTLTTNSSPWRITGR